jgi:hypothetical protein
MYYQINYKQDERNLYRIIEATNEDSAQTDFWAFYPPSMITQIEVLSIELWEAQGDIDQSPKILDEVKEIIYDRSEEKTRQYGSFPEGMNRAAMIFNGWTGLDLTAEHVYKMLVALKFSRESFNKKHDNMLDAIAYLTAYYEHYKEDYDATK